MRALLSAFLACSAAQDAFALLREIFLKADGEPRDKIASKKLAEADPALSDYLMSLGERYLAADERMRAAHAASLAEAALTLADRVRAIYAAEKRLRGVLDYDDLIAETLKLLKRREAAAWVLYKLDGGLDHILIDEAQDTSPEQWDIVRALTEEFFAGKGARGDAARTIFAVGDEKQSIFSFQGADPVQFEINRRHFALHAGGDGGELVDVQLATSRRSAPEVLAFVDEVFADPAAREGLTSDGAPVKHSAHRAQAKGRVEFWSALKPADTPERDWRRPVDVLSAGKSGAAAGGEDRREHQGLDRWAHAAARSQRAHPPRRHHDPDAAARAFCERNHPPSERARCAGRGRGSHQARRADRGDGFDSAWPLRAAAGRRFESGGAAALAADRLQRGGIVRAGRGSRRHVMARACRAA